MVMTDGRSFDGVKTPIALLSGKKVTTLALGIGRSRKLGEKTLLEIANGVQVSQFV